MSDVENVRDAIKTAIQMEKDGYSFYKKAAAQTNSDMGKTIFEGLAADEQMHLDVFEKMFEETVSNTEWNDLVLSSKKYAKIPVFPKDLKEIEGDNPNSSELDALRMAMDSEKEAIEYYSKIKENLNDSEVIKIIDEIIEQEKNHYSILEGEFNHINSTGYWFELDYLGN
ncbi:MAG: ferritin family protein [Thermoplasmatales archaeon]|jgi:rubrerythrin|nr:ferritin family protein [Thermoplasmatales archaeon]